LKPLASEARSFWADVGYIGIVSAHVLGPCLDHKPCSGSKGAWSQPHQPQRLCLPAAALLPPPGGSGIALKSASMGCNCLPAKMSTDGSHRPGCIVPRSGLRSKRGPLRIVHAEHAFLTAVAAGTLHAPPSTSAWYRPNTAVSRSSSVLSRAAAIGVLHLPACSPSVAAGAAPGVTPMHCSTPRTFLP
jgi:hypothetical protein